MCYKAYAQIEGSLLQVHSSLEVATPFLFIGVKIIHKKYFWPKSMLVDKTFFSFSSGESGKTNYQFYVQAKFND